MNDLAPSPTPKSPLRTLLGVTLPVLAGALALSVGGAMLPAHSAIAGNRDLATSSHIQLSTHVQLSTLALHDEPAALETPAPVVPPGPDYAIGITAVGLQAEVDACQWVRMDFTADVPLPIVAAHNFCGGGIVLEMNAGQTVSLTGEGLDGTYVVVSSKDAWADQDATDAISGLSGDVILQTCYWEDDGHLILVALQRVA